MRGLDSGNGSIGARKGPLVAEVPQRYRNVDQSHAQNPGHTVLQGPIVVDMHLQLINSNLHKTASPTCLSRS